jgi:hypothetical protein
MKIRIITLLFLIIGNMLYSQLPNDYTETEIQTILTNNSASEGDLYHDITNNTYYIGTTNGSLKIIGDITSKGSSNGDLLSWNATTSKWEAQSANLFTGWSVTGNTGNTNTNFLGNIDDVRMQIRSNNLPLLEFGRRQTLGLTQNYPDYTDNNQPLVHVNGDGSTAALQFAASAANFYKPMFLPQQMVVLG